MRFNELVQVMVGTGKSKLRLYDTKHGRRPVLDLTFGQSRITSLAAEPDGEQVDQLRMLKYRDD